MDFNTANVETAVIQFYCSGGSPEANQWLTQAQVRSVRLVLTTNHVVNFIRVIGIVLVPTFS